MNKKLLYVLSLLLLPFLLLAQEANIVGEVVDSETEEPMPNVAVYLEGTAFATKTNAYGQFSFEGQSLKLGDFVLIIEKEDYSSKKFPVQITEGATLEMGQLYLQYDLTDEKRRMGTISLSDDEIGEGDDASFNISGLLQASRDTYLRAAAFDFSAAFFRPRGYDNARGKVLVNGLEMNKQFTGRPQWGNWGGMNDIINSSREFSMYSEANEYTFGDIAGTTNLVMRASQMRKGGRVSNAFSNRTYEGRVMASYNTGMNSKGWAFSFLASRRYGDEGFREGTPYDANSFFIAVEKRINEKHSLNLTSFYAPNRRGIGTAITQEMRDLKGIQYNPNWGYQNGKVRSTRIRRTEEPVFVLSHFWDLNDKIKINTNAMYQTGRFGTTRVNNGGTRLAQLDGQDIYLGGARNPSPIYYQNLPSYFLQDNNPSAADYQAAWFARERFVEGGQFEWDKMYETNFNNLATGGNSTFVLQEDRVDDTQLQFNSIIEAEINQNIRFNGSVNYRYLLSENFAELADLLGGERFLDVDFFAEESAIVAGSLQELAQSDVRNPNRQVTEGERFQYNYEIEARVANAFSQFQFTYNKLDFYVGGNFGKTYYQRNGLYENGFFRGDKSFGKGKELDFTTYGVKLGGVYKITGRHMVQLNASRLQNAPTIQNSYSNARQNHEIVDGLTEVKINSADIGYIFRTPKIKARVSGYYTTFEDETDVGFYFTQSITDTRVSDGSSFIQEVTSGIDRRHTGLEFGFEYQVTPTILLKTAGNFGQYIYTNDPDLYLTGRDFPGEQISFGDGKTSVKNLRVPGGPQQAYQLGFEYRDPDYWNIGLTANYFADNYISPSFFNRSDNFVVDNEGFPFPDYNEEEARKLLQQEKFSNYFLFNLTGGKSWKINGPNNKRYFVGFFAVIGNLFDQEFTSGGFEQSRRAAFGDRGEDLNSPGGPLFGNRYFYGFGRTYYLNFYLRF
ncbi:carboxypeptidase-like regulatory domain-containing protein [Psychroflexus maritimus]|uniref:TonB-dependent receptor n=1 Tax=Psychroflexus maritimus TaxID=2714865 RepID=A0A967DZU8_9FLAO|nr:carboxypeptidase-like regulatory domain-containing protein [Psychroflexus maritimus]NGZ89917.1 TonB-dependent receptor [Psychroflexus maritimus]